jgi:hypothetical protein
MASMSSAEATEARPATRPSATAKLNAFFILNLLLFELAGCFRSTTVAFDRPALLSIAPNHRENQL